MKYLAKIRQFHVHVCVHGHFHVRVLSVSVSMSVSVSVSVSMLFHFKHGTMNIYGRHGKYIVDFQGSYKVAGNLKDLSYERGWLKSADNLGASPFKRDLSNNTTFIETNLTEQSRYVCIFPLVTRGIYLPL
jgi:hypothetical protein